MKNLTEVTKDNNFLFFAAVFSVVLATAVFLFFVLNYIKVKTDTPISSAPKEKTMAEIIKDGTTPILGEEPIPVSKELIKTLTVPAAVSGSKTTKTVQPSPIPVSKDYIKNLTTPIK